MLRLWSCTKLSPSSPRKAFKRLRHSMSALQYRDPIVLKAKQPQVGTVIFSHGLGDSGEGWEPAMFAIQKALPNVKFILPNAPIRPITCNMGIKMPGWYDILEFGDITKGEDKEGLEESKKYLAGLINAEIAAGTPADKIILGGFSQGGAITYYTVFSSDVKIAGALVLSGYLPLYTNFAERLEASGKANAITPLMACHGVNDPVIPFDKAKLSFDWVQKNGIKGSFHQYKGLAHGASDKELTDVAAWIKSVLSDPKL